MQRPKFLLPLREKDEGVLNEHLHLNPFPSRERKPDWKISSVNYQILGVAFLFGASLLSLFVKNNHAAEPFYQGKTLRVIVASAAGGGSDIVARLMMRHLPRHIP